MQTTLLSSKGQVIIPKALRDAHRWHPGTRLQVVETADGILLKPVQAADKMALPAGLLGIRQRIAYKGRAVSIDANPSKPVNGCVRYQCGGAPFGG